jgi:hypothetical protein
VFWYRKERSWAKGEKINLDFHLESFVNESEDAVFKEIVAWVKKNLDPQATIEERKE